MKNLIEKYKLMPVQVRASFWFLVCGVLQNGLSVITLPIFTRLLSTEQYGLSSTYFAWNDLIVVICTLRLSYGVFDKGMIKYSHSRDKFESSLLGLTTTISFAIPQSDRKDDGNEFCTLCFALPCTDLGTCIAVLDC